MVAVGQANLDEDRTDSELMLVDVAARSTRVLTPPRMPVFRDGRRTRRRPSLFSRRGDGQQASRRIFTLAMEHGGDAAQLTHFPTSIEQIAWRPDGRALAIVAEDKESERKGRDKFNDAIEIGNNDFLAHSRQMPAHLWVVELPSPCRMRPAMPQAEEAHLWFVVAGDQPAARASRLARAVVSRRQNDLRFVKVPTPLSGDALQSSAVPDAGRSRRSREAAHGRFQPLESIPVLSPDGSQIAYLRNQDGKAWTVQDVLLTPASGGSRGRDITRGLDRNVVRAIWMPDGKSLLVGANDRTTAALWIQPADGSPAQRIQTGDFTPAEPFWVDASVGSHGEIAFAGSTPSDPSELFFIDAQHSAPVQLTHLNDEIASREIARQETITWPGMKGGPLSDGVITYPIGYQPGKKYPLVLYIHGGPTSCSKQTWTMFSQLFAAQGWMVFEPNYRGQR